MFNFKQFLEDFNIPIPNVSKNTGKGWINIQCPFCNDQKNHLGFNYEENYFNCWKCNDPVRGGYHTIIEVIEKLLPYENPRQILKQYDTNEIIVNRIHEKLNKKVKKIIVPGEELKPMHIDYLKSRGLDPEYIKNKYKLLGTTYLGNYRYRIIIPIYFQGKIVTFQTRTINDSKPRYVNCDPENEIIPIKDILYNIDNCKEDFCILTEGVFKVFKLDDNSLASLGKNYTKQQLKLLTRFKIVFIYFDPDESGQGKAKKLSIELDGLGIKCFNITHEKAPDNLNKNEVTLFWRDIKKALN